MEKVPADLQKALKANPKAQTLWSDLTQISRRDFISWIESAKQEETRKRRVGVAIDRLLSGQWRPCCYAVVPMNLYKALGENPKAKAQWKTLSADSKRDISDWVEKAKDSNEKALRVNKACAQLAIGKSRP